MLKPRWTQNGPYWNYMVGSEMVAYTTALGDGYKILWRGPKQWFLISGIPSLEEAKRIIEQNV